MRLDYLRSGAMFWTPHYAVVRWSNTLCDKPNTYRIISMNVDLDLFRGIKGRDVHINCVVDDFGNLVRVAS